jgi:hypothetical protein
VGIRPTQQHKGKKYSADPYQKYGIRDSNDGTAGKRHCCSVRASGVPQAQT